jgi:hypothetical protein
MHKLGFLALIGLGWLGLCAGAIALLLQADVLAKVLGALLALLALVALFVALMVWQAATQHH